MAIQAKADDTLVSSDIVGYNTVTLKKGWNMLAVNFQQLGETSSISVQELFPGTTEGLTGGAATTADQIQIYDATTGGYTTYFLFQSPLPIFAAKNGKWVDVGANVTDLSFSNGDVFWYLKRGESDVAINVSGQVSLQNNQEISIVNGWNMIGNAFPANFNPNALGTTYWQNSGAVAGAATTADQIQIYDNTVGGYTTYFLFSSPLPIFASKNWQWVDVGANVVAPTAEVMPVGKGAWYLHRGSGFTLTIPNPTK